MCKGEISWKECVDALKDMSEGKSPGIDGFTPEFCKVFWKDVGIFLVWSINHSYKNGQMSITQISALQILGQFDEPSPSPVEFCQQILVSFQLGSLEWVISKWTPNISCQLQESMPTGAGRKENEKGKKRTRKTHTAEQSTTGFWERVPLMVPAIQPDEYQVVFLQDTKALTCYGCGMKGIEVRNYIILKVDVSFFRSLPKNYEVQKLK